MVLAAIAAPAYAATEVFGIPRITRYRLTPPHWPDDLHLRIAAVADIHACEPWMSIDRIGRIVDQTNSLNADLILLLGDYVGATRFVTGRVPPDSVAKALSALSAPLGVHAILGNHDYWVDGSVQRSPATDPEMASLLRANGIPTYINTAHALRKDGHTFWIAGLADQLALLPKPSSGRRSVQGLDDLEGTLSGIPDGAPLLLMAHEPDIFRRSGPRPSLVLSGHTHGGQVDLFGWRPVSASSGSKRYPAGHFIVDGRHLIVSKGLGITGLPVRVGCWPEIVMIELGAAQG